MRGASIIGLLVAGILATTPLAWAEAVSFSTVRIGDLPSEFEVGLTGKGLEPLWGVVPDDTAEGGRALEQRTPDPTDYRFALAIYKPAVLRDVALSVRFKPMSGRIDQAGGIAVRLLDQNNYYVVRANALEGNVRFYRVVRGRREQIASADAEVASGQWHTLAIRAKADQFSINFDGQEMFKAADRSFGAPGHVGLWTKADSITRFHRITIQPIGDE
jgi:hypothetical protein